MFFSVSPIKPGFRRRRRAAPLRLFQFLRNFFLLLLLSRSAFFFFFFQARARFLVALLLSEYLFLTSKQQRHRCRTPRLKSAASGCVSPISPCSDARDGRQLDCFLFNLNFQLILGARGFRMTRCGPLLAPLLRPLWPACGPLWPAVARLWPLMAPCGPFVFYGRTFEKFSRGPLCGPPGHRATRNFSKVRISRFFHFSADGRRYRKRRESIILSFLLLVDRRPKNEKKTKNPNL